MTAIVIALCAAVLLLAAWVHYDAYVIRRERKARRLTEEGMHEAVNAALLGCPAVKVKRPEPIPPGADSWYWLVLIDGKVHHFTDEAKTVARNRALALTGK